MSLFELFPTTRGEFIFWVMVFGGLYYIIASYTDLPKPDFST